MKASQRLDDLDAIRSGTMLLGVFWHAGIFLIVIGEAGSWPTSNGLTKGVLDVLVHGVHVRMPVFFVLAGFFSALVLQRSGEAGFVRQRAVRIGVPLLVATVTVVPLTRLALRVARDRPVAAGDIFGGGLGIVWFLWYLLLFYAVTLALLHLPVERLRDTAGRAMERLVASPARVLVLAVPTTAALFALDQRAAALTWVPDPVALAFYAPFYAFGWLLFGRRHLLAAMRRGPVRHAVATVALAGAYVICSRRAGASEAWETAAAPVEALFAWTAVFAAFAVFWRIFDRPRPRIRYLADSAYWVYLAHGPLVVTFDAILFAAGVPLVIIVPASALLAIGVLLLLYEHVVRYGVIGRVLHGPRRRAAPSLSPIPSAP